MKTISILGFAAMLFFASHSFCSGAPSVDDLVGVWSGPATIDGNTAIFTLRFAKNDKGNMEVKFDLMKSNIKGAPLGEVAVEGDHFTVGPVTFQLDESKTSIHGELGKRKIIMDLKKDGPLASDSHLGPLVKKGEVAWTYPVHAQIWSSPAFQDGTVYFGSNDGKIYALQSKTGKPLWNFKTGGKLLGRPTLVGESLFMLSDDGLLYKLNRKSGKEIWRFDTKAGGIKRSPSGNGKDDNYDFFTSAATIHDGLVFIGSANNKMYAVDEQTGAQKWEFQANDLVRSTPAVALGLVFFGSWDHFVYAVEEKTGALKWKYDTTQPITSSPAYADGTIYIGSRSANIYALDAATGDLKWRYFYWFSWVESSASVRDGILYVGSSDYELVFALDTKTGKPVWSFDTDGSPWSSPVVTQDTVFIGSAGSVGYMVDHRGGFFAINRADGKEKWRMTWDPIPNEFNYGVASSPTIGDGLVFFGGLDGIFYAVKE